LGWYENKEWQYFLLRKWSMTNIKHGFDNENDRWVFYSIIVGIFDDNDENMLKKLMATVWGLMTMTINDRWWRNRWVDVVDMIVEWIKKLMIVDMIDDMIMKCQWSLMKKSMIIVDMIDDNVNRMIIVDNEIQWPLKKLMTGGW